MKCLADLFRQSMTPTQSEFEREDKDRLRQFRSGIDNIVAVCPPSARARAALGWTIHLGTAPCFVDVMPYVKWDDADWHRQSFIVECQFFYFFIHLANRRFYSTHGEAIGDRWQRELAVGYVAAFIDRWFETNFKWPDGMTEEARRDIDEKKAGMHPEMMANINVTGLHYSSCSKLLAEDGTPCSEHGLFSKLARNVAEAGGIESPHYQFAVENAAFHVFLTMGLWDRIDDAARELIARPVAA